MKVIFSTRPTSNRAVKGFLSFDPREHEEALKTPLGEFFLTRVKNGAFSIFAIGRPIIPHIAGLYWLDFNIQSGTYGEPLSRKRLKMEELYAERLTNIAELVQEYVTATCLGELRHLYVGTVSTTGRCGTCAKIQRKFSPEPYKAKSKVQPQKEIENPYARSGGAKTLWAFLKEKDGTYGDLYELLLHGYCMHNWRRESFGGRKWGYISYICLRLFCARVEGDVKGMARELDFLVHAVHNGANCLNQKFTEYSPGDIGYLSMILTAKFNGRPCCWNLIRDQIPKEYGNKPEYLNAPCICTLKRSPESIGEEETAFCEFFRPIYGKRNCEICTTEIGEEEDICGLICTFCEEHGGAEHEHYCPICNVEKKDLMEKLCPNGCKECFAFYIQMRPKEVKKPYFRGCYLGLEKQHPFCHSCGKALSSVGTVNYDFNHRCINCLTKIECGDSKRRCPGCTIMIQKLPLDGSSGTYTNWSLI